MTIIFKKKSKEFHIYNDKISYVICVLPNGHIGNLYFGKRLSQQDSYLHLLEGRHRAMTSYVYEDDENFSLQHTRQEYACYGTGDFSLPAFEIKQADGSLLSNFVFEDYRIFSGKPTLEGLPATYVEKESEATSLEIQLIDKVSETRLFLLYTIYENLAAVTRSARFEQLGQQEIRLTRALSLTLDLPDKHYDWLHLDGAWSRERHLVRTPLSQGCQSVYSLKGASSSEHNPFLALLRPNADEHQGEVLGFSLVYSGNFLAQIDVTPYQQTRVSLGIHPEHFEWRLAQGNHFQTPEVVIGYSEEGLNGLSQIYHNLYQKRLARGYWRDKERPILLNNWEAMTFDFDEERILKLAQQAADVGVELFVMDDGWFGARDNDQAGLGDWKVNLNKLPNGLTGVIAKVHEMGMSFGLWIEPEMVNKDSDLYRQHPDWIFHHPHRSQSHGRHQFTLDLSREEVFQNIYQQLYDLLSQHDIDYIKWDMNRYMTEVFSLTQANDRQGEIFHRYILNLYRLFDRLTSQFPKILFESCSSGGARFDPGLLYYAPQVWTSDDSDAIERLKIQYGTSIVYPLSTMGCHVSEVPNQQVSRLTPLETRANVAYFGAFGYELDLSELTTTELHEVKEQIAFYKRARKTFQYGRFTRLMSPFEDSSTAWQVMSESQEELFVGFYRSLIMANEGNQRLYLKGLDETATYQVNNQAVYSGSSLMYAGLPIASEDFPTGLKDFASILYRIQKL
ncbi:Bifunctional alpha-galactosidase/sucrose kinase AgaSK [Streptococcus canis]|uniref:Alpha-galactosidase n=1 Tax=Streptococcus canis TaxID=1329 RepID=A0A3P5Y526_STRCB|nr:alpha-galactosidase [Streptococcus canis]MDV5972559.1 alpha-galactosidase [Streptococcus canis]QKG76875.1 alpha-galactosidase [Streptococcus canis]VDC43341.1 Bifunctional alpha-galactosidase/sucrose kinase AgaSK [Streptococcus canis]